MLFILVILNCCVIVFAKYDCTKNASILMEINEIIFFETPIYPGILDYNEIMEKNFTFSLAKNNQNGSRLTLVFTVLTNDPEQSYTYISFLTESSITLRNYIQAEMENYYPNAIQGYAFFEMWKEDSCPFESISRDRSFQFTDNTQLFYVQSAYINQSLSLFENPNSNATSLRTSSCRWRFKAPFGYGFKVVLTRARLTQNTEFMIFNTTDVIVSSTNVRENYPYYNNDDYIEINLSEIFPNILTSMELQIAVSVEKLNVTKTEGNCLTKTTQSNRTIWYLYGYDSIGYNNNIRCFHTEIVTSDLQILVWVDVYCVESYADYISYYYENERIPYQLRTYFDYKFFLTRYENGSEKVVHFEFESDGSVQALGFRLVFEKIYCNCNDEVFRCDNNKHTIMKDTDFQCQYLKCNFTIQPCKTGLTFLKIYHEPIGDIFQIISNDVIVFDASVLHMLSPRYFVFLNSSFNHYLQVQTSESQIPQEISVIISQFKLPPPDVNIILSFESPTYLLDSSVVQFAAFELSKLLKGKNTSITVYGNGFPNLYNNKSLTINIPGTNCLFNDNTLPYKCYIKNMDEFAIYQPSDVVGGYTFHYFVVTLTKQPNCVLEDNVFFANVNSYISSMATDQGPCHITFYVTEGEYRYISHLWTNSKTENVQVFVGPGQTKLFFEFKFLF